MSLDGIAKKIAGFGVPGLVLLVAVSATGYAGAAAVTTSLAAFGGPLGMIGGVAMLGLIGVASGGITEFGIEAIFGAVVDQLVEEGHTQEEMVRKIENYPISKELELKLKDRISNFFDD